MTGLLATVAGRQVFVPGDELAEIEHGQVTLRSVRLDLQPFERRPQEVLLKKDVLDRQLINVDGARLVRANEIELARLEGWFRVVGVDIGLRGWLRRLLPRALATASAPAQFLDWASVEPFTGHVPDRAAAGAAPEARAAPPGPARRSRRGGLAPRGRGDHRRRSARDPELEADVFEELEPSTSSSSSRTAPTRRSRGLLARMEADDAADLRRSASARSGASRSSSSSRPLQRRRVRALLGYDPATAGGLMSPEFVCVYAQATRPRRSSGSALALAGRVARLDLRDEHAQAPRRGGIPLADLLRADTARGSASCGAGAARPRRRRSRGGRRG